MRIGLNGFGRIGRLVFRIIETKRLNNEKIKIVAINCSASVEELIHFLQYDSVHGKYLVDFSYKNDSELLINNNIITKFNKRTPEDIDWDKANVDYVIDCTGSFRTMKKAEKHLSLKNVKKVLVSSPSDDIPMYVMGVNENNYKGENIISNASCTTNCLAPLVKIIHDNFEIKNGLMSTIHSTTSSQNTLDNRSKKNMRVGRCCLNNIIPTSTGAAKCVTKVIPELENKITGMAFRVPTPNVSVIDLTIHINKSTTYKNIIKVLKTAEKTTLKGILKVSDKELVSSDFLGDPHSCIIDEKSGIELNNNFFKIIAWYDNEFGYSLRLVELLEYVNNYSKNN